MSARKIKQLNLVDCSRKVICGRPVRVALVLTVKSQEGIAHTSNCIAASMKTMMNESSVLEETANQHKKDRHNLVLNDYTRSRHRTCQLTKSEYIIG